MLSFIPTPIGNREDITMRALRLLKECTVLFCEDTRTTKNLYRMYDIAYQDKKLIPYTSYIKNISQYIPIIREKMCGVVSEAGCPWLSDPWKSLIQLCRQENIKFNILPGANALIPAVVATPSDTSKFVYLGFPPHKKWRQTFVKTILQQSHPVYIYESVHRVEKLFKQLKELWYDWKLLIARELTKMFEEYLVGTVDEILKSIEDKKLIIKWEFVIGFFK